MKYTAKITLFQLFFLSFAYVFSGLFLVGERSFLSLLIPAGAVLLFSAWGYSLLQNAPRGCAEKERLVFFLSCGMPKGIAVSLGVAFVLLSMAEAVLSLLALCFSAYAFSSFLPFWLIFLISGVMIVFIASHGLTVIGRLAELMAFLIVPLMLWILLWRVEPIDITAFSSDLHVLFTVTPAPILFLFSSAVLKSTAMPKEKRLHSVPLAAITGAAVAVLCTVLFLLYGASENNIFFLFFGWMTSVIRIGMLLCVKN